MKSCIANVKGRTLSRLGLLSLLALMILTVSTGKAIAAGGIEDLAVFTRDEKGVQKKITEHLKEEKDVTATVNWLSKTPTQENFEKFLKGTDTALKGGAASNPIMAAQGWIKAAQASINATPSTFEGFRKALFENMEKVKGPIWGNVVSKEGKVTGTKETAFKTLLGKMFGTASTPAGELAKITERLKTLDTPEKQLEYLRETLLNDPLIMAGLGLSLEVDVAASPTPDPLSKADVEKMLADAMKRVEDFLAKKAPEVTPAPVVTPGPAVTPTPSTPPLPGPTERGPLPSTEKGIIGAGGNAPDTGEQDKAIAQQVCNNVNKANQDQADRLKALADQITAATEKALGTSQRPERKQRERNNGIDGLVNALKDRAEQLDRNTGNNNQGAVAPNLAKNTPAEDNKGIFNQPIPEKKQQEEEDLGPMQFASAPNNTTPIEVESLVQTDLGAKELRDGRQALRDADAVDVTKGLNPQYTSLPKLMRAQKKAELDQKRLSVAAANAKEAADDAEDEVKAATADRLAKLTGGLPKRKEQLEAELARKKQEIEGQKSQAGAVGNNIQARQALAAQVAGMQQEANAKQAELDSVNAALKEGEKKVQTQVAGLKATAKKLSTLATQLEAKRDEQASRVELVSEMVDQRKQIELAALQPQAAPGTRNVYGAGAVAGGVGGPRTAPITRGATGSPTSLQTGAPNQRKPLSGK